MAHTKTEVASNKPKKRINTCQMIMKIKWQCNKLILVRLKSDKTVVYKNCDK